MAEDNTEEQLDNNVLKLLACVKYKHKNINNIISDPEMYVIIYNWLYSHRYVYMNSSTYTTPLHCCGIVKHFKTILTQAMEAGKNYKKIARILNNNSIFIPSNTTTVMNATFNNQYLFQLSLARLTDGKTINVKKNITTLLQEQSAIVPALEFSNINDYMKEFRSLKERIATGLEQNKINIKNDDDLKNIYNTIDRKEKRENKSSLTKENNNISNINNEEKSINSLKENNNDIREKEQEVKPEEQSSKELEKKSNANDVNIQITNMKDATKIEEGKDTNANNILLQNKNTQIKTSNNIDELNLKINPEISSKYGVEINNKNSNETKPQNKNNNDPTFEDENENNLINNNQSNKYNLCKDCNCKCWPFN